MSSDVPETGFRVLLLEDAFLIATELERTLREIGCGVIGPAPSVARAMALLERERPDFAILDVNLGRERSTPVAEALLARGVPFALSTGYERTQLPESILRDAPQLGKPVDRQRLVRMLSDLRHHGRADGGNGS